MSVTQYPAYEVIHGTYLPSESDFYMILSQSSQGAPWNIPPNFLQTAASLGLQAVSNSAQYPNAYVVGTGAGYWTNDAAAKAAAQADYASLISARNTAAAAAALSTVGSLGLGQSNQYITIASDSPVSGPG